MTEEMPAELRRARPRLPRRAARGHPRLSAGRLGPGARDRTLDPSPEVVNIAGSVHGGVLYTLKDSAFEVACKSYGRICVALDVTMHHVSDPPLGEPVVAEAVEVSRSARVASYRITAAGAGGEVRSWYLATTYRTSRWHLGESRWTPAWRSAY